MSIHEAFAKAMRSGEEVEYRRTKIMVIGQERAGKTSTIKSLLHGSFDSEEPSTKAANQQGLELSLMAVQGWRERKVGTGKHLLSNDLKNLSKINWRQHSSPGEKPKPLQKGQAMTFNITTKDVVQ